jgi:hypothetical protein
VLELIQPIQEAVKENEVVKVAVKEDDPMKVIPEETTPAPMKMLRIPDEPAFIEPLPIAARPMIKLNTSAIMMGPPNPTFQPNAQRSFDLPKTLEEKVDALRSILVRIERAKVGEAWSILRGETSSDNNKQVRSTHHSNCLSCVFHL